MNKIKIQCPVCEFYFGPEAEYVALSPKTDQAVHNIDAYSGICAECGNGIYLEIIRLPASIHNKSPRFFPVLNLEIEAARGIRLDKPYGDDIIVFDES